MAISFNNIPNGIRVPLFYAEVDNSMANTAVTSLKVLLLGQKTDGGSATVNKPVLVTSASAGVELFGAGSQLAILNAAYRLGDSFGEVWGIPVADPSGAKATGAFAITGTATGAGTVYAYIGANRVTVGVASGDAAATVATNLAAAINANILLPVTASASNGTVTVEAKNAGSFGNDIGLAINRQGYAAGESLPEGIGIAVTAMAGGSGAPALADAIAAMGDDQYDLIVCPWSDATSLDVLKTEMNDTAGRWSPMRQLYGHVFSAMRGSVSALQAFGATRNDQHCTIFGIEPATPSLSVEVLGAAVARAYTSLSNDPARPLQTLELIGQMPAPAGSRFTLTEKQVLLTHGIATLYTQGGYLRIERAITTYQHNAYGASDNSYLDVQTLFTLQYILRDLKTVITSKYGRHKLADDGAHFGAGQAIVTPRIIRGELIAQYQKLEALALVENLDAFKAALIVERDANDPNRVNVLLPPDLVNQLRIFAVLAQFRLQY